MPLAEKDSEIYKTMKARYIGILNMPFMISL